MVKNAELIRHDGAKAQSLPNAEKAWKWDDLDVGDMSKRE